MLPVAHALLLLSSFFCVYALNRARLPLFTVVFPFRLSFVTGAVLKAGAGAVVCVCVCVCVCVRMYVRAFVRLCFCFDVGY